MNETRLKMNPNKTEVVLFGSRHQLNKLNDVSIKVLEDRITSNKECKYLGAWLDETMSFRSHVKNRCKAAIANICRIMHIQHFINQETCEILVYSLVISHLDYANGILTGVSECVPNELQRVQNWVAKLILQRKKKRQFNKCMI